MALVAKRTDDFQSLDEASCASKRRKMSLQEVETELHRTGLCQPALSLIQHSDGRACQTSVALKRAREEQQLSVVAQPSKERVQSQLELGKRRRVCEQLDTMQIMEQTPAIEEIPFSIAPYCSNQMKQCRILCHQRCIPRFLLGHRMPRMDQFGLTFSFDNDILVADFPPKCRPRLQNLFGTSGANMALDSEGTAYALGTPIAKIALDWKGTAFFLCEDGQLLAAMPAIRSLENMAYNQRHHEVKVQLVVVEDGVGSCQNPIAASRMDDEVIVASQMDDEVLSFSTDLPEDLDDLEGEMDMD